MVPGVSLQCVEARRRQQYSAFLAHRESLDSTSPVDREELRLLQTELQARNKQARSAFPIAIDTLDQDGGTSFFMDVVGLISGGKDSLFNLVECQRYGHRIVALANLYPAPGGVLSSSFHASFLPSFSLIDDKRPFADAFTASEGEELDSHMFQMVGHHAVKHQAEAMGLPLIRRATTGVAVHRSIRYESANTRGIPEVEGGSAETHAEVDEVEDLYKLLEEVVASYPSVRGVAVGAILSNYQRFRVEAVCRRLGLVPLAYLWQCRQGPLLDRMLGAGVDAVLVKVACMGLRVSWLGKSLAELRPQLEDVARSIGMNVCGEGGEYETFVRYIPGLFKHGRVVLTKTEIFSRSTDEMSPDAFMAIRESCVEPFSDAPGEVSANPASSDPPRPDATEPVPDIAVATVGAENPPAPRTDGRVHIDGPRITIASLDAAVEDRAGSVEDETHAVLRAMQSILAEFGATTRDVVFVHLQLSDMGNFASMNTVYKRYFGSLPPSRACVETELPAEDPPVRVRLDCWAARGSWEAARAGGNERSVLHVESISSWAPVSLGPYAQANQWGGLVWMAGQIGLDPGRMQLTFPHEPVRQVDVAWRHVTRVLAVHNASIQNAMSTLVYIPEASSPALVREVLHRCWQWLAGAVSPGSVAVDAESAAEGSLFEVDDPAAPTEESTEESTGPFFSVTVPVLPKNAHGELEVVAAPDRFVDSAVMHSDMQTPLDSGDGHWIGRTSTLPGAAMSLSALLEHSSDGALQVDAVSKGLVLTVAGACADGDIPLAGVHRMRVFLTPRAQEAASDTEWRAALVAQWAVGGLDPGESVPAISILHTSHIGTGHLDAPPPEAAALVEAVSTLTVMSDEWLSGN